MQKSRENILRNNRYGVIIFILVKVDADSPLSQAVLAYLRTLTENTADLRRFASDF
jgi:hypothetical protein